MVSFSSLVVCVAALASVCNAHAHGHQRRGRFLNARQQYPNGTVYYSELAPLTGTGSAATSVLPSVTVAPELSTSTLIETATKFVTVTYTLGDGRAITKTITKTELNTKTIVPVYSEASSTPAAFSSAVFVQEDVAVSVAPSASEVDSTTTSTSTDQTTSTSTTTLVVTIPYPTSTVTVSSAAAVASSAGSNIIAPEEAVADSSAACSVTTVYVPQYITQFSTITATVTVSPVVQTPPASISPPPFSNSTMTQSYSSTTTLSVYVTLTETIVPSTSSA
ncbi:hypothetical protein RUND412_003142 [Rhizina undulata]